MQQAGNLRVLDRASTALAHQLPGVSASASSLGAVLAAAAWQACVGPQLCTRFIHQPAGRSMIMSHVTTRLPSPPLESDMAQVTVCCLHSGGAQSCGRCTLTTAYVPWRVATPSPDGLDLIRGSFPWVLPLPALLFPNLSPLGTDVLAHSWPRVLRKYAFPLLAQTLGKLYTQGELMHWSGVWLRYCILLTKKTLEDARLESCFPAREVTLHIVAIAAHLEVVVNFILPFETVVITFKYVW